MNQFAIRYVDRSGNRWSRVVQKPSLKEAHNCAIRLAQHSDVGFVIDVQPFGDH